MGNTSTNEVPQPKNYLGEGDISKSVLKLSVQKPGISQLALGRLDAHSGIYSSTDGQLTMMSKDAAYLGSAGSETRLVGSTGVKITSGGGSYGDGKVAAQASAQSSSDTVADIVSTQFKIYGAIATTIGIMPHYYTFGPKLKTEYAKIKSMDFNKKNVAKVTFGSLGVAAAGFTFMWGIGLLLKLPFKAASLKLTSGYDATLYAQNDVSIGAMNSLSMKAVKMLSLQGGALASYGALGMASLSALYSASVSALGAVSVTASFGDTSIASRVGSVLLKGNTLRVGDDVVEAGVYDYLAFQTATQRILLRSVEEVHTSSKRITADAGWENESVITLRAGRANMLRVDNEEIAMRAEGVGVSCEGDTRTVDIRVDTEDGPEWNRSARHAFEGVNGEVESAEQRLADLDIKAKVTQALTTLFSLGTASAKRVAAQKLAETSYFAALDALESEYRTASANALSEASAGNGAGNGIMVDERQIVLNVGPDCKIQMDENGIVFTVGESSLSLTPTGLMVSSETIALTGTSQAKIEVGAHSYQATSLSSMIDDSLVQTS